MEGKDLEYISLGELRKQVSQKLGFFPDALDIRKKEVKKLATELIQSQQEACAQTPAKEMLDKLLAEEENLDARQEVYLITISHVIQATLPDGCAYADLDSLERKAVAEAVLNAFDDPIPLQANAAGRPRAPRVVDQPTSMGDLIVVYKELHDDDTAHFHVVVKLVKTFRFKRAKQTLQMRHLLPSHFSCSHTLLWSAVRYGYIGTPKKPDVDESPWVGTPSWAGFAKDSATVDLFELSQEPFRPGSWRKRREEKDKEASRKAARTKFEKLDLTAIMMSKHLWSKDGLIAYAQDHGTAAMQRFVHNNQKQIGAFIKEGKEWASAKDNADFEAIDDWSLVNQAAEKACPHGESVCLYKKAVQEIFERNQATLDWKQLAQALRAILSGGPSKTTPVPFLVGPSNSGKSTVVFPFDDLYTPKRVFHKPALGSSFGCRNLVGGGKRLIFWDDFPPVAFAHEKTVPVSLFLSLFQGKYSEIQVSQSFNDGNEDVRWNRGVIFTCKQEGLWETTARVSAEEVRHMRNRCREFSFTQVLQPGALKDVTACKRCMCRWMVEGAAAQDASPGLQPLLASPAREGEGGGIAGFQELLAAVQLPVGAAQSLAEDLEELGAVSVAELTSADWESLNVWATLRTLQKRRLLQHVGAV